jgi:hypothetical protein
MAAQVVAEECGRAMSWTIEPSGAIRSMRGRAKSQAQIVPSPAGNRPQGRAPGSGTWRTRPPSGVRTVIRSAPREAIQRLPSAPVSMAQGVTRCPPPKEPSGTSPASPDGVRAAQYRRWLVRMAQAPA